MCCVELLQLFPGKIGDLQRVAPGHNCVRVVRENLVLKVLGEYSLVVCLKRNRLGKSKKASAKLTCNNHCYFREHIR